MKIGAVDYRINLWYAPREHATKCEVIVSSHPVMQQALWDALNQLEKNLDEAAKIVEEDTL